MREQREFIALCTLGGFAGLAMLAGLVHMGMQFAEYQRQASRPKKPWERL